MRKLVLLLFATGSTAVAGMAQTLFTFGNHSVSKEEFLRVYKKNSINRKPDMTDTALNGYLKLYSLFRMKVAEADKDHLDTVKSISSELDNYRRTLAKNYLTDDEVTNKLIHEAYDRMKMDVHAAHILVSCNLGMDTVAPYRKIDSIYHVLMSNGASFESLAENCSDDKSTRNNGGDIGYFTGLQTIYSFENEAYSTPVGKYSKPFRTQFGYHILKVISKTPDRGQVKVAQIMIACPKSKGATEQAAAKQRADSVEAMLNAGTPFDELVKKYSDDKFTANENGVMKPFGAGSNIVQDFQDAAFALKKPGDYSAPIHTEYGYHIIKLVEKIPLAPYDSLYPQLKRKVEGDSRSMVAKEEFRNRIKEKSGFKENEKDIEEITAKLEQIPDTGRHAKMVLSADYKFYTKPVFAIAGRSYTQYDFVVFFENLTRGKLNGPKSTLIKEGLHNYENTIIDDYEEHKLADENPEFRNLMEEYRDGIMLFELMDRHVWSKAAKDTPGLTEFYNHHKQKYMWEAGFDGSVYKFKNKAALDTGRMMINANKFTDEEIAKAVNKPNAPDLVSIQRGRQEFSHFKDATLSELQKNKEKLIRNSNGTYTLVVAKELFSTPSQKSLDEARGYVIAEYQDYLEKQWNEKMRAEYPMHVDEKVFESMVQHTGGKKKK